MHKMGDIGRDEDSHIRVYKKEGEYLIGNFEEGFGFIGVKFHKNDVRFLTQDEIHEINGKWFTINNNPLYQIKINCNGDFVETVNQRLMRIARKTKSKRKQEKLYKRVFG